MEIEDSVLVRKCKEEGLDNFGKLYEKYVKKIYNFIYFKTHHKETAQDITSDVFLKVLENLEKFNEKKGSFKTWAYTIARNSVIDFYRKDKGNLNIDDAWDLSSEDDLASDTDMKIKLEKVKSLLNVLNKEQREIVIMRVWNDLSYEEISEIIGKTKENCRMIFSRSLNQIKSKILLTLFLLLAIY